MTRVVGLLGSGEFLPWTDDLERFLLGSARQGDGSIAILPTASAPEGDDVFERWARMGLEHYAAAGIQARVIRVKSRDDASSPENIASLHGASMIFFSGGNPAYLAQTLRDTPFWEAVLDEVEHGVALAGCSAGACFLGAIAPDPNAISSIDDVFKTPGLQVLPGLVFGAHWDMLDTYLPGLRDVSLQHVPDDCTLIGLDEDTAMASDGSGPWRVFGTGKIHVYDNGEPTVYAAGSSFTLP